MSGKEVDWGQPLEPGPVKLGPPKRPVFDVLVGDRIRIGGSGPIWHVHGYRDNALMLGVEPPEPPE